MSLTHESISEVLPEASEKPHNLLADAKRARAVSLSIVPAHHIGELAKRPTVRWKMYQATIATESRLDGWFGNGRVKAMAVVCGEVSGGMPGYGLVVIDFDIAHFYEAWRKAVGPLADGLVVVKTGKGFHVYLRCQNFGRSIVLAYDNDGEKAIETRAEGGYVIMPPSLHQNGSTYEWIDGDESAIPYMDPSRVDALLAAARALDERTATTPSAKVGATPVASHPPMDLKHYLTPHDAESRCQTYLDRVPSAIMLQDGSGAMLRAACECFRFGLDESKALPMLRKFNAERCHPPFNERQLLHKFDDAKKKVAEEGEFGIRNQPPNGQGKSNVKPYDGWADSTEGAFAGIHPTAALSAIAETAPLSFREIVRAYRHLRDPVIHGLLRIGETMNVIAPPKAGKSWLVLDLAFAIALGSLWLGTFRCERGSVLILDNELHAETLGDRIPKVAAARGFAEADYGDRVFAHSLRGELRNINDLGSFLEQFPSGRFSVIILDAFYRFLPPGTDENDNGAIASLYNTIDRYALRLGCSFVLIHHTSKGVQGAKATTDVGAGAGAFARAADCHLVLRHHETVGAMVAEAAVRSWPPVQPMCLRWTFPVWNPAPDLDPTALLREQRRERKPAVLADEKPVWTRETFIAEFVSHEPRSWISIIDNATTGTGLKERPAKQFLRMAEAEGKVFKWTPSNPKHPARYATVEQPVTATGDIHEPVGLGESSIYTNPGKKTPGKPRKHRRKSCATTDFV